MRFSIGLIWSLEKITFHDWLKSYHIVSGGLQMGGFCFVVEFYREGSSTNRATPSSFNDNQHFRTTTNSPRPFPGSLTSELRQKLILSLVQLWSSVVGLWVEGTPSPPSLPGDYLSPGPPSHHQSTSNLQTRHTSACPPPPTPRRPPPPRCRSPTPSIST